MLLYVVVGWCCCMLWWAGIVECSSGTGVVVYSGGLVLL